MHLFKFSVLVLTIFSLSSFAIEDNKCLKAQYDVEVIHKGQPFGLLPVILKIKKNGCIVNIYHEHLKFFKNNWTIDVCREPVHIKKGVGAVSVLKKVSSCKGKAQDAFCADMGAIFQKIQDDGLIFAEGQKESLDTAHGKTYCAYLLAKKYLSDSLVFNRGDDYAGVLQGNGLKKEVEIEIEKSSSEVSVPRPVVEGVAAPVIENEEEDKVETAPVAPEKKDAGTGSF